MIKNILKKVKRLVIEETKYIDCNNFEDSFFDFAFDLVSQDILMEVLDKYKEEIKNLCDKKNKIKYKEVINYLKEKILKNYENFSLKDLIKEIKNKKGYTILVVGFNGHGKTTNSAKLVKYLKDNNLNVLFINADVFRPAAIEQFNKICKELNLNCFSFDYNTKSKYICKKINELKNNYDVLIIDTAGRSYENYNLMKELNYLYNCIKPDRNILVIESSIGNDLINQYEEFKKAVNKIDFVIFSKFDLYNKEGVILSLLLYDKVKILFLGIGEKEFIEFNIKEFINAM